MVNKGTQCDQQVLKMVIMLQVKILKFAWFDIPAMQNVISDVIQLGTISERHRLISLTFIEELIVEMGYVTRGKHLHLHRRISVNFRDIYLMQIFSNSIDTLRRYTETVMANQAFQKIRLDGTTGPLQHDNASNGVHPAPSDLLIETLLQALNVLEKCLNYDWTAVLCNETLD